MPVWKAHLAVAAYELSAVENPDTLKIEQPAQGGATVRSKWGYFGIKYDLSPAKSRMFTSLEQHP